MKRRNFLSLTGAAIAAPLVPFKAAALPAAAGYNRYMYGLAVFHARTRASVSAADLVSKLRVSTATADALMGEMTKKGILTPALNAATGTMRAISPNGSDRGVDRLVKQAVDRLVGEDETAPVSDNEECPSEQLGAGAQETDVPSLP